MARMRNRVLYSFFVLVACAIGVTTFVGTNAGTGSSATTSSSASAGTCPNLVQTVDAVTGGKTNNYYGPANEMTDSATPISLASGAVPDLLNAYNIQPTGTDITAGLNSTPLGYNDFINKAFPVGKQGTLGMTVVNGKGANQTKTFIINRRANIQLDLSAGGYPDGFFNLTSWVIKSSNITLDCNNATFTGSNDGGSTFKVTSGVQFAQDCLPGVTNDPTCFTGTDAILATADNEPIPSTTGTIANTVIRNCSFLNYGGSGMTIANRFNRNFTGDFESGDGFSKEDTDADINFYNSILLKMDNENSWDVMAPITQIGQLPASNIGSTGGNELRSRAPHNIHLYNLSFENTGSTGIYVQNSVSNMDLNQIKILYARVGIYLEPGTRKNIIRNSAFLRTGYVAPGRKNMYGRPGREGIAIDSSALNLVQSNLFYKNMAGGVQTYKNCWEQHAVANANMSQSPRRQASDENQILNNVFVGGLADDKNPSCGRAIKSLAGPGNEAAIGIAGRQWSDSNPGGCGDRWVGYNPRTGTVATQDFSKRNVIQSNIFHETPVGVYVYDDDNIVSNNSFDGKYDPVSGVAALIQVGNKLDARYLGRGLVNNQITNNTSHLTGSPDINALITFAADADKTSLIKNNTQNGVSVVGDVNGTVTCNLPARQIACVSGSQPYPADSKYIVSILNSLESAPQKIWQTQPYCLIPTLSSTDAAANAIGDVCREGTTVELTTPLANTNVVDLGAVPLFAGHQVPLVMGYSTPSPDPVRKVLASITTPANGITMTKVHIGVEDVDYVYTASPYVQINRKFNMPEQPLSVLVQPLNRHGQTFGDQNWQPIHLNYTLKLSAQ
jgi:hypothetical protein